MYMHLLIILTFLGTTLSNYFEDRDKLKFSDLKKVFGAEFNFTEEEKVVNNYFTKIKLLEYDNGIDNPDTFLASKKFWDVRELLEKSEVFQFLRAMPKGGLLHVHDIGLLSFDKLYNLTYEENLNACLVDGMVYLKFMMETDVTDGKCTWELLSDLRKTNAIYDIMLKAQMTLLTNNRIIIYPSTNAAKSTLEKVISTITSLLSYRPVLEKYLYQALEELDDDNVNYLEFRSSLFSVYELNGTVYEPVEVAYIYKKIIDYYKRDNRRFIDARLIYAPHRHVDNITFTEYMRILNELILFHKDFLAGFDLVGYEEQGHPLSHFATRLLNKKTDYYFHAGETNWFGTETDLNLLDAVMLGSKRIGHGFNLMKYPSLMNLVKEKKIGIEVCPISNQVFQLVGDLRNHPAGYFIANTNYFVVGSDYPSYWGSYPLSHDFYFTIMGIAGRNGDLRVLKTLAAASFVYTNLEKDSKDSAVLKFFADWYKFINHIYKQVKNSTV